MERRIILIRYIIYFAFLMFLDGFILSFHWAILRSAWMGFDLQSRVSDRIQASVAKISRTETGRPRLAMEAAGGVNHGENRVGCEGLLHANKRDELPKRGAELKKSLIYLADGLLPQRIKVAFIHLAFNLAKDEFRRFAYRYAMAPDPELCLQDIARRDFQARSIVDVEGFKGVPLIHNFSLPE